MQLLNFSIIKLTLCLIIGVIIGYITAMPIPVISICIGCLLLGLSIAFFKSKSQFITSGIFGVLTFLTMICIGVLTTAIHDEKNNSKHYTNVISIANDSLKTINFRVRSVLKPDRYYNKYYIDLLDIDRTTVKGKSLLHIKRDSIANTLPVDGVYLCAGTFKTINSPLNPNQFDYKNYLSKQYIYHQVYASKTTLIPIQTNTQSLLGIAYKIREHINNKLKTYDFTTSQLAIINALILGQRQDISKTIYNNYVDAGAIHILAISGLHIGILLIFLNVLFKPLERFKKGKLIKTILLVSILWSFALIAGLSASVTRAVTMFSIVAIAMNLKRPTHIYNTLAISIFILLLCKPLFLFDVGFQLSYLAVFAIVAIDPLLYNLWRPKYKIIDLYWHTFTVSISAQLGIIPVSLYYFHQFSGLFIISNLVIIPFLGIILGFGIVVLILSVINLLPNFLVTFYGNIISLLNDFVNWVALQEQFLFKAIAFNLLYVIAAYFIIITSINFFLKKHGTALKVALFAIIGIQLSCIYTAYNTPSNTLIVFHKNKHSLIGHVTNSHIKVSHDMDSLASDNIKIINDFVIGNHIKTITKYKGMLSFYKFKDQTLLVIDSLGVYNIPHLQPDVVLLRQSPKINLSRLIETLNPKQIIADGSNYKSYMKRWETICKIHKRPFHQTGKKGAFIMRY